MKEKFVIALALSSAILFLAVSSGGAISGPAQPANLEVLSRTETSITLGWGPTQPDPFFGISEGKNSITIGWGVSQDSRSAVTYNLYKDGKLIASNLLTPQYTINGLNGKRVVSFRTCAEGVNAAGLKGPQTCSTWSKG